tara:strand:- start:7280 stop:8155 length:876 start_codon:yes stop_codon:yes gene_type:complete
MSEELKFLTSATLIVLLFGIKLLFGGATATGVDKYWKAQKKQEFLNTVRLFILSFDLALTPWLLMACLVLISTTITLFCIEIYPNTYLAPVLVGFVFLLACLGVMNDILQWRARKFETQLIDAMEVMIPSLRIGNNTVSALRKTAENLKGMIQRELNEAIRRIDNGLEMNAAMARMIDLYDSEGVRMFVIALQTKSRFGGDLAMILASLNETLRERIKMRMQMTGQLSGVRLTAFLLAAAPYILYGFFYFIQPEWNNAIHQHPLGNKLLYSAMLLQIAGMVWMFYILNSEQ